MPVPAMSGSGSAGGQDVWMAVKELWTLVDDAVVRKLPGKEDMCSLHKSLTIKKVPKFHLKMNCNYSRDYSDL